MYLKPLEVFLSKTIKVRLLQSSESVLWGWGCSAAAPGATWRSVLGSAAGPAWSGRPGEKQCANIVIQEDKCVFLASKWRKNDECFSGVSSNLHWYSLVKGKITSLKSFYCVKHQQLLLKSNNCCCIYISPAPPRRWCILIVWDYEAL